MQSVRAKGRGSVIANRSDDESSDMEADAVPTSALTCDPTEPPSKGLLLPLGKAGVPVAILAYNIGDFLEFEERSNFGAACVFTRAAMASGTSHPLYAKLYLAQAAYRQLLTGVELLQAATALAVAKESVKADRTKRENEERIRAGYADVRKNWAFKLQSAFAANPRDPVHLSSTAKLLGELGRTDSAVQVLRWGLLQFPKDRFARLQLAGLLLQVRPPAHSPEPNAHTDEAITQARLLKDLTPNDSRPRAIIARALLLDARELNAKGNEAAALAARQAALAELRTLPEGSESLTLAMVEHSVGYAAESAAALETHLRKSRGLPVDVKLAEVYAWRGEPDLALACLEQALEGSIHDPGLCYVAHSPFMDNIRGEERWLKLQRRMNRAPDQLEAIPCTIHLP